MIHSKLNQKGFAVAEAILIIIALVLAAGTGYYVYNANKKTSDTLSAAAKVASSSPPKTTKKKNSNTSSSSSSSTTNSQKYLVIKEWGVEIPLSGGIQDAYYAYYADGDYVRLGTKSLTAMSAQCAPDNISVAAISRQTVAVHDANATQNNPSVYPAYTTKVGDYYYGISQAQAACGNTLDGAASQQQAADIKLFKTAFQGVQTVQ